MPLAGVSRTIHNRLPAILARLDVPLGELARRTMLPARVLARLRSPRANPPFRVAQRIACALDVRVEEIFGLHERGHATGRGAVAARRGLGPLLAELRLSDVELASAAGLDRAHVNRLKNGRTRPSVGTALAIAAALGVDVVAVFPAPEARGSPVVSRRRRSRSVTVGGTDVGRAAVGATLSAEHDRPAELDRKR